MKRIFWILSCLWVISLLVVACFAEKEERIQVVRFAENPILDGSSSDTLGNKLNGPSLIRVPEWVKDPLGKYYLYFAHHKGNFIRLAYADDLHGPWRIYEPGTIHLEEAKSLEDHIASPDVHIDHENQTIRMYLHGSHPGTNQCTVSAVSKDGLTFDVFDTIHGYSYFRVFEYKGANYAIDALGFLNRSDHPDHGWERHEPELIGPVSTQDAFGKRDDIRMRHSAVYVRDDVLYLFYTRKSDAPERIVMAKVPLEADWKSWKATDPIEVLRPELDYEGIAYPNAPSGKGGGIEVQELRDPGIFEEDGQLYLLYSVAGEEGIAIAELRID
ncbi:MAG: hypothetical protein O3C20_10755 [Verrucomicrobia bacterium]|nr:hypothetical protein [Verrucomicrobiota bacterium]